MKKEFSCFNLASITVKILAIFLTLFTQFLYGQDSTGTITDIDGNVYKTVKIDKQWWMAENLKVTKYRNGDPIPNVIGKSQWINLTTGAYCDYNNAPASAAVYGRLYNWYAVNDSRNIAPAGWHVASDEEWKQLEMALGMSRSEADDWEYRGTNEGSKLAGNAALWLNDGDLENNSGFGASGFSALPGGFRSYYGYYNGMGFYAFFWFPAEDNNNDACSRNLNHIYSGINRINNYEQYGFSIRCVRD